MQDSLFGEDDDSGEFSKGFSAGTEQILGLYSAAKATLGSVIDDDQMVADGLGYYQEKMREAEKYSPNVGTLEEIDFSDEGGFRNHGLSRLHIRQCASEHGDQHWSWRHNGYRWLCRKVPAKRALKRL